MAGAISASAYALTGSEWLAYLSLFLISASFDFKPWLLSLLPLPLLPLNPSIALSLSLPHLIRMLISKLGAISYKIAELYVRRPPGSYFYLRNQPERAILLNVSIDLVAASFIFAILNPNLFLLPLAPISIAIVLGLKGHGDDELPFMPLFGWMASLSGSGGVEAGIEDISSVRTFPLLYRVKLLFFKLKTYFSCDALNSLRLLSRSFKGELGEFLDSYHSVLLRGGDVPGFLKSETEEMLDEVFAKWRSKVSTISTAAEVLFIALGLLPAMMAMTSFIGLGTAPFAPLIYALPPVYVTVLAAVDLMFPSSDLNCNIMKHAAISSATLASLMLLGATRSPLALAIALTISSIPASAGFIKCWLRARSEERYILQLLRRAVDGLKAGSSIAEVLGNEHRIRAWWAMVESGTRPTEAFGKMAWTSRRAARAFYSLCVALERGAGLEALELLYRFFRKLKTHSYRLHAEVGWVIFFALATPFISAMSLGFMAEVSGNAELLMATSWLLLENSLLSGLLASKLATFTIKSVPIVTATMATAALSLALFGLP